jgi:hypothetical protein
MSTPLLTTKLYIPPPRPNLVPRPCLIERLNAGLDRKLTLISASVGAILGPPANLDRAISGLLVAFRFDRVPIWTTSVQADGDPVGRVGEVAQRGRPQG